MTEMLQIRLGWISILSLVTILVHGGTPVQAQNWTAGDVVYYAYFSDESCQEFAGIVARLPNDPFEVLQVTTDSNDQDISCVDAMACFYQPDGKTCQAFGASGVAANVEIEIRDDGIYECDTSNSNLGEAECSVLDSSMCFQSSISNCHFRVASSGQMTESPQDFIPPSTAVDGLDQYAFLVYYADEACTEMAGLRGFTSENPYSLPRVGEEQEISCQDSMPCFLYDTGVTCEDLQLTGEPAQGIIRVSGEAVYECDSSNESVDELLCDVIDPLQCKSSSVYDCNFHYRSAVGFAMDPENTLKPEGNMTETVSPALGPTVSPAPAPTEPVATESPTSNAVVPSYGLWVTGWVVVEVLRLFF